MKNSEQIQLGRKKDPVSIAAFHRKLKNHAMRESYHSIPTCNNVGNLAD